MDVTDVNEEYRESIIQEYIQLREEIRIYLLPKSRFEFVLTMIAALAGISITISEPLPLLLMTLLPIFLIDEHTRKLDAIHRIASYIRAMIEPKVKGLNWETFGNEFLKSSSHFSFSVQGLDVIILTLLTVVQFLTAAIIWNSNKPNESIFNSSNVAWLYPIGAFLVLSLMVVIARFHLVKPRGQKYVDRWQEISCNQTMGSGGNKS